MLRPLNDTVIVSVEPIPEKRGSVILLDKDKSFFTGLVLAVGPGKWARKLAEDEVDRRQPMDIKVGDRVVFHAWHIELKNGQAISSAIEDHYPEHDRVAILRPEDIHAVLDNTPHQFDT